MRNINKLLSLSLSMALSSTAMAGTMGPIVEDVKNWYLDVGAGYSDSRDANIHVFSPVWDFSIEGYTRSLGSTASVFAGLGNYLTNYLSIDARYEHRGTYQYNKVQTGMSTGTSGFTGVSRTRYCKVGSDTAMVSAWLDIGQLYPQMTTSLSNFSISPFVGAGIGADYLNVSNFRTVSNPFIDSNGVGRSQVASINDANYGTSFAWHAAAGLSTDINNRTKLSIGYNYFDGGRIPFPNYITSSTTSPVASSGRSGVTVPAWQGRLRANEVYAMLQVLF